MWSLVRYFVISFFRFSFLVISRVVIYLVRYFVRPFFLSFSHALFVFSPLFR